MSSTNAMILDAVRAGKNSLSKKDIAAATGLAWGTMHKAVAALIRDGALFARAGKATAPGRPCIPLCIDPEAAYWCGVDIGSQSTRIVLCDLDFHVFYRNDVPTERYSGRERFLARLCAFLQDSIEESGCDSGKLRGIGLAVSGNVDSENSIIVSGGNFGIRFGENISLEPLAKAVGVPIYAVSTQTAAVCAEYRFGRKAGCSDLVTIGLGVGIGSGIISNGRLLMTHPRRPVGYIGHILIPGNRRKCSCGFTGCLEAYSGGEYLKAVAEEEVPSRVELHDALALDRAAAHGDPDAVRIMTTAANYNAAGIAAMIQLYAPQALVFSGGQVKRDGFLYNRTLEFLREILPEERRCCDISITVLGEYQSALGAARLAYEKFF